MQEPEYPMQFITLDIAYMIKDKDGYRYILLIGDLFSKYIAAVPLREQTAEDICIALHKEWMLVHGIPNFLLTDQGSNVDGEVMRQICEKFGVEKRRTSAYHSQGNGFAERSIRNVKETFRTHLLGNNMHQNKWRTVLKEIVFALNTTVNASTKCVPYTLVHGRDAVIPEDVRLGRSKSQLGRDISSPSDFASKMKLRLEKTYKSVNTNLKGYRARMVTSYNTSVKHHDYAVGDEVWLRKKNFKCGESEKLSPRRTGPWTVVEVKENGRNFLLRHRNGRRCVVHHDRLSPVLRNVKETENNTSAEPTPGNDEFSDAYETPPESLSSSSDESDSNEPDTAPEPTERRYPLRIRTQRQIPGAIPWDENSSSSSSDEGGSDVTVHTLDIPCP